MSKNTEDDKIKFHASASGRSHIDEREFFKTEKVKKMVNTLLDSSIYKQIKDEGSASIVKQ